MSREPSAKSYTNRVAARPGAVRVLVAVMPTSLRVPEAAHIREKSRTCGGGH